MAPIPTQMRFVSGGRPEMPATGLPAEVLKQRPDVQAARLRVEAADQRVGAALAERFPPLVLSGSIGLAATSP